ncbi:CBS domain-containing protein [Cellulosilyticum sp. I15G10I2]|uniref:CBS domain-containing protein n=1 Tax=Cellulosilyticum sp. I15G10I2 TaxID=1892843 RepID=UPI00085C6B15|nr:CBS domain-containing protein [Cellulosilyticum sp. I15G10I2]
MRARDIMKKGVIFVKENDSIEDVLAVLMKNNISGVPVVDQDRRVVGVVTEQDLITKEKGLNIPSYIEFVASILFIDGNSKYNTNHEKIITLTAKEIMSSPAYTVYLDASIEEIASVMVNRRINRVPVIDKERKLAGIIGRGDLLPILIN